MLLVKGLLEASICVLIGSIIMGIILGFPLYSYEIDMFFVLIYSVCLSMVHFDDEYCSTILIASYHAGAIYDKAVSLGLLVHRFTFIILIVVVALALINEYRKYVSW